MTGCEHAVYPVSALYSAASETDHLVFGEDFALTHRIMPRLLAPADNTLDAVTLADDILLVAVFILHEAVSSPSSRRIRAAPMCWLPEE